MILVDSSVWIDYFNGRITRKTGILDDLLGREPLLTGDLILIEVLQGFRDENDFHRGREILSRIPYMDMVGREIALQSAKNFRFLRKNGVTVRKTINVIIATFCRHHGFSLLHDDRDFDPVVKHFGLDAI